MASVRGYQIFPLGDSVDTSRTGKIYYRQLSSHDRTKNFQGIMSRIFNGQIFEYRLVLVITFYEVPQIGSTDSSIVSYQTNISLLTEIASFLTALFVSIMYIFGNLSDKHFHTFYPLFIV